MNFRRLCWLGSAAVMLAALGGCPGGDDQGSGGDGGLAGTGGQNGEGGSGGGVGGAGGDGGVAGDGGSGGNGLLCQVGACEDDNECTSDVCDPINGACSHPGVTRGTVCDQGAGTCQDGACVDTPLCQGVDCNDGNQCTSDVCDSANGQCSNPAVANGTSCDRGTGACQSGVCQPVALPPTAPSGLSAAALSESEIQLTWNDNSDNEDGFRVHQAEGSCSGSFAPLGDLAANTETVRVYGLAPDTLHCYRVSAYNAIGESSSTSASARTEPGLILRIINDLYNVDQGDNKWSRWNEIVYVRIGPYIDVLGAECNSVKNSTTYERLNPSYIGSDPGPSIRPGYTATPTIFTYEDFDVSSHAPGKYCVYLQAGWWEYVFDPGTGNDWWEIHPSSAVNCAGQTVYGSKWNSFWADHNSGRFDIYVSEFLPHFQWQGSSFCQ